MIWFRGEVVPDGAVRIVALDRTFEHGLGLFETFRTWDGHPTLLSRHLDRMRRSARELGLTLNPDDLPDERAVEALCRVGPAHRAEARDGGFHPPYGDLRLRIVLSGGLPGGEESVVWMTAGPLPPPTHGGARIRRSILADPDDPLARHKTLNYWRRRIEQARAAEEGADEVLCSTPDGRVCEGTRSNLFLVRDGRLITPGTDGPLLDGIMRRVVIEQARAGGLEVVEETVTLSAIGPADEAFLTNSVRGMLPVARLLSVEWPAPGPVTQRLWGRVLAWLNSGGTST